jgi:Mu-like prophage I protein
VKNLGLLTMQLDARGSTTSSNAPTALQLAQINALQSKKGKPALLETSILVIPVRLTGTLMTAYFTRFPDAEILAFADQINADGGPMLFGHDTDDVPTGTFFDARATAENGAMYLDTHCYVLNDDDGIELLASINAGIVNEASIGFGFDRIVCSITGGDYWDSPYSRGQTYEITDPQTGQITTKMCFAWLMGCKFNEGSLVYKGAHPGTQVGGTPPSQNRFQSAAMAFSAALEKPNLNLEAGKHSLSPVNAPGKGVIMTLAQIAAALGLPSTATEQEVLARLGALNALTNRLTAATGQTSLELSEGVVLGWKDQAARVTALEAEVTALKANGEGREKTGLIDAAMKAGQLSPAQKPWAETLSIDTLKGFLSSAPTIVNRSEKIEPERDAASASLSAEEREVMAQLGITDEKAFMAAKLKRESRAEA